MSSSAGHIEQGDGTLSAAAGCVSRCRADLDRTSRSLTDQLAALQGRWSGRGGAAFVALHQAWDEQQARLVGALDRFEESLRATERDVLGADEELGSGFSRLAGRLDGGTPPLR